MTLRIELDNQRIHLDMVGVGGSTQGDLDTAVAYGERIAKTAARLS